MNMVSIEKFSRKSRKGRISDDSIDDNSSDDGNSEKHGDATHGNPGWADSIANVLSTTKPKTKKTLVLSKAKKLTKVKREKPTYDFEIEGEIKEEKPDKSVLDQAVEKKQKPKISLRVRPNIADREREKALKKIATKGVVQLFNAVRAQQKDLEEKLKQEKLDHKKDAVLNNINRRKFLDVLMSGDRAKSEFVDNLVKKEEVKEEYMQESEEPEWGPLRDDFMTGKKYKNWDQDENEAEDQNSEKSCGSETD